MKRIYDWDAKFCLRNYTTADLLALKGVRKLTQTTANSEEEAAAAADAGIDLIMGNAVNAEAVRAVHQITFTPLRSRCRITLQKKTYWKLLFWP